jgi:hypothetical protein
MRKRVIPTVLILLAVMNAHALAGVAVSLDPADDIGDGGWPSAGTNQGWHFRANQAIRVTHLGLLDQNEDTWGLSGDGLDLAHPIGLWRVKDAALLTSGTLSAGTGDLLLDHFRYVDTPDITLASGEEYIIAFFSGDSGGDFMITEPDNLVIDPAITLMGMRFNSAGGLAMPVGSGPFAAVFGPNFQYESMAVPAPGAIFLGAFGVALVRRMRRHRRL